MPSPKYAIAIFVDNAWLKKQNLARKKDQLLIFELEIPVFPSVASDIKISNSL